ncbi:MAG: hypothetical protein J6Y00_08135 [Paludibacteraceae bacterium]|nr:hypothetical protein [Paludibacteraceae bacterium]
MGQIVQAEIITIGDELLIGQVLDTNSAWMAEQLNIADIAVYQITSVHDSAEHIRQALSDSLRRSDIVLLTGGLGPTKDDITKRVLCDFFHTRLIESDGVRRHVEQLYKDRPIVLNRLTATQWLVPETAIIMENRIGSAPIMVWEQESKIVASMPGVPTEMQVAMDEQILPFLQHRLHARGINTHICHRTLTVRGIPESALAIELETWENALPEGLHLAYLPKDGTIRLRLSSYGECTNEEVENQFGQLREKVRKYLI